MFELVCLALSAASGPEVEEHLSELAMIGLYLSVIQFRPEFGLQHAVSNGKPLMAHR
jgi:hypothetical protein